MDEIIAVQVSVVNSLVIGVFIVSAFVSGKNTASKVFFDYKINRIPHNHPSVSVIIIVWFDFIKTHFF
jgi:hypothetical protein